jgi:hypothetical protein
MSPIKITKATNFVRVFRLPDEYPSGYCFDGERPVKMQMVDWFNPSMAGREYDFGGAEHQKHIAELRNFIRGKGYFDPSHTYLLLTDYGDAIVVNPDCLVNELERTWAEIDA